MFSEAIISLSTLFQGIKIRRIKGNKRRHEKFYIEMEERKKKNEISLSWT